MLELMRLTGPEESNPTAFGEIARGMLECKFSQNQNALGGAITTMYF